MLQASGFVDLKIIVLRPRENERCEHENIGSVVALKFERHKAVAWDWRPYTRPMASVPYILQF